MSGMTAVVAGAGVVGLAAARALAVRGMEVIVLEAQRAIGMGISSRNSEVIHAGIYYPKGSLKARACVEGKKMLYRYCAERAISHQRCGKLIVATDSGQMEQLSQILDTASLNGVDDLELLSKEAVQELEPSLCCEGAILCPSTGIVDSHSLMLSLQGDVEANGGIVVFNTPIEKYEVANQANSNPPQIHVHSGGDEPMELACDIFVNAAGLHAPELARRSGFDAPTPHFAKGNYYKLDGCVNPFNRLIYPIPEKNTAGLGVHATIDLDHQLKFGPDVEWLQCTSADAIDIQTYQVDPNRCTDFYSAIRKYWPDLPDDSLVPDYSGIRFVCG